MGEIASLLLRSDQSTCVVNVLLCLLVVFKAEFGISSLITQVLSFENPQVPRRRDNYNAQVKAMCTGIRGSHVNY